MSQWHEIIKGYLRYKTIASRTVSYEAQVKNFFYYLEKLCFVKFLYFQPSHDLPTLGRHDEY